MTEYHQPVLLKESIEGLNIKPDGIFVDVTFGGGGHSKEILKHLKKGTLVGFDQDEDAVQNIPDDDRFIFVRHNFRFLKNFLRFYKINSVDGILADLGVSSHHFDTAGRGFSFRYSGDIDMRMNRQSDFSAKDLVNTYNQEQLIGIFKQYGELKNAYCLAKSLIEYRDSKTINAIEDLMDAIAKCLPKRNENQYLAKVFQALRIEVNHEIDYLKEMLIQAVEVLKPGGRLVVISYHSLEDRLIKNLIKWGRFDSKVETDLYGRYEVPLKAVSTKVIVPSSEEIQTNSRARSAKLRIGEKL